MNTPRLEWLAADPASESVLQTAAKVAATSTTVLITGESGTGKDHLARWIHEAGPHRDAPFLKIDSASLPSELVESELFGHERGAFTGAQARKLGRLELARGGTIVLDEVAALTPGVQAKLLRVIEEKKFERLGGNEALVMDSRLIALTNSNLELAVASGRFREDLFFRLNVLVISIPPLRDRPGDIRPLAVEFLARLSPLHGYSNVTFDEAALQTLESYSWPGNVRELKNVIERALILSKDSSDKLKLGAEHFPSLLSPGGSTPANSSQLRSLEEMEKEVIQKTLEETHYKIAEAAKILGISRKTLLEKRKKFGIA